MYTVLMVLTVSLCGDLKLIDYEHIKVDRRGGVEITILDDSSIQLVTRDNRSDVRLFSFDTGKYTQIQVGEEKGERTDNISPDKVEVVYCDPRKKADAFRPKNSYEGICQLNVQMRNKVLSLTSVPDGRSIRMDVDESSNRLLVRNSTMNLGYREYLVIDMKNDQVFTGEVDKRVGKHGELRTNSLGESSEIMEPQMWLWVGRPYIIYARVYLSKLRLPLLLFSRSADVYLYVLDVYSFEGERVYTFRMPRLEICNDVELHSNGRIVVLHDESGYYAFRFSD